MKIDNTEVVARLKDLPPGTCFYYKGQLHMVVSPGTYKEELKESADEYRCLAVNLVTNSLAGLHGYEEEILATAKIVLGA